MITNGMPGMVTPVELEVLTGADVGRVPDRRHPRDQMRVVAENRASGCGAIAGHHPRVAHAARGRDPARGFAEHRQEMRPRVAPTCSLESPCEDGRIGLRIDDIEAGRVLGTDRAKQFEPLQFRVPVHAQSERKQLERREAVHRLPRLGRHAEETVLERERAARLGDGVHSGRVRLEHPSRLGSEA